MQKIIFYTIIIFISLVSKTFAQEKTKKSEKQNTFEKQIEEISTAMEFIVFREKNELKLKIDSLENWAEFDDKDLRIELLKEFRGLSNEKCKWKDCSRKALNNLVFCEQHAYTEMGIRK